MENVLEHRHYVFDSDPHFSIDPITRAITNQSKEKTKLIQYDHNSERFTFEIPRYVEEHDMSLSNRVEIHYINISGSGTDKNEDVYICEDTQLDEENGNKVVFSWLISRNATIYSGKLNFLVKFICSEEDKITYAWNTAIFTDITIANGMNNGEPIVEEYSDILQQWYDKFVSLNIVVDKELSPTSENLVQNKVIAKKFEEIEKNTGSEVEAIKDKLNKNSLSANFDLDKLELSENGLSLKTATGLPDHTNLIWLKGQKDTQLLEFTVTVDELTKTNYARFFISQLEDIKTFLFFPITISVQTNSTRIDVRPILRRNETNTNFNTFNKTLPFVKENNVYNFKIRIANGIVYIYCENLLMGQWDIMEYFTKSKTLGCSYRSEATDNILAYKDIRVKETCEPYMHLSYDDCIRCLKDLNTNADTYNSIFDNAFFASLRNMHKQYGAVFTLNLFRYEYSGNSGFDITTMTTKFKSEFAENADWLKFSVHWTVGGVYPDTLTDDVVVSEYNAITDAIIAFSSYNNVDWIVRPSYFSLSKSSQIALKNSGALFSGCLTADDVRENNCGLTAEERTILSNVDDFMDYENEIYYCRTTYRMDSLSDEAQIVKLDTEFLDRKNNRVFIVFCHEKDDTTSLEASCRWAKEHGVRFDYPMYNIPKLYEV